MKQMKLKGVLVLILKVAILTLVWLVCFVVASGTAMPQSMLAQSAAPAPEQASGLGPALLAVAFLNTAPLAYTILSSRWSGWRLMATVFLLTFGIYTFMSQIETAAFPAVANRLPAGMLPALFLAGALQAALFAPPAVLILGKWKRDAAEDEPNARLVMPPGEWAWKLAAIALVYVALYFTFGYYVAWRNPAVHTYYGGADPGSLFGQVGNVMRDTPWLPFFQFLRGILWTLLALPVIRMMKRGAWATGLAVGLLFALVMNAQLLLPNPYMPDAVRMAHLVETASSNFIFGWVIVWLLHRRHSSLRDLFGWSPDSRVQVSPVTGPAR
jgi:hypothetical protein